jgi:probable rRNA maturation factor
MRLPPKKEIKRLVAEVSERERLQGRIGVIFVDDSYMTELNQRFAGKETTTDVLAFPLKDEFEKDILGEIYISVDRARRQAKDYGIPMEKELRHLVIHGLLHLAGYSHSEMRSRSEEYLNL